MSTIAYLIPHDDEKPIQKIEAVGNLDDVDTLVFEGRLTNRIGISVVGGSGVQFAYDDMGLFTQAHNLNRRAMKLWANAAGLTLADFRQPLVGNYLVMGYSPDTGETIDVPAAVETKLTSDWINE